MTDDCTTPTGRVAHDPPMQRLSGNCLLSDLHSTLHDKEQCPECGYPNYGFITSLDIDFSDIEMRTLVALAAHRSKSYIDATVFDLMRDAYPAPLEIAEVPWIDEASYLKPMAKQVKNKFARWGMNDAVAALKRVDKRRAANKASRKAKRHARR